VGGERAAKPRVLTMLNPFTSSQELTDFAEEVSRLSDGALRIRIIPAGHASRRDFEAATIRDVLHGRADLAMAASRAWDEFGVRGLRPVHAPLLIDSYPLQKRVLKSDLVDQMLAELRPLGLVGIGILPGAIRHPVGLRHRLAGPEDFSGLTRTFTDGGGIAPNKPGEHFVFGFSAYRDTLTVTPVKGELSPLPFRARPWRRLATTPTRQFFSKRCPPPAATLRG
jgi:hypothetical protein